MPHPALFLFVTTFSETKGHEKSQGYEQKMCHKADAL
jgi:hypothetical protein